MKTSTTTQFSLLLLSNAWLMATIALAQSPGEVVAWGNNATGKTNVPATAQSGVVAMALGWNHVAALKNDGSVIAWGYNYDGQVTGTPTTNAAYSAIASPVTLEGQVLGGVTAIATMVRTSVALKNNGTVVAWGRYGQTNVPVTAQSGVVAIAANGGDSHALALKEDGSVVAWGNNNFGQTNVPPSAQTGVVAITVGGGCSLALKSNGSVVVWGNTAGYETNVSAATQSGVTAVAAGGLPVAGQFHGLALKNDGSVVAWGDGFSGQVTGTPTTNRPVIASPVTLEGQVLSGVTAIAAGEHFSAALKSNGSVVVWGDSRFGLTNVPVTAQSGVTAIAAGSHHVVALKNDGSVVAWGWNENGQTTVPSGLSGVIAISAIGRNTMALRGSGWDLGAPLALRPSNNAMLLSWPTNATGFTLQSTFNLTPPVTWLDLTNPPTVFGGQFTVTNPVSATSQFFRLRRP